METKFLLGIGVDKGKEKSESEGVLYDGKIEEWANNPAFFCQKRIRL